MSLSRSRDRSSSVSSPATAATTPEAVSADDDIWASDHENDPAASNQAHAQNENLLSDLPTVKRQHMTDGYREGLGVGKAKVMQKGFDDGYPIGVMIALRAGQILGCIEGVLAAKDIPDEQKAAIRKQYEQAKSELAISSLLKDMNDQMIMESNFIPAAVENTLKKWETVTSGTVVASEECITIFLDILQDHRQHLQRADCDHHLDWSTENMLNFRGINVHAVSQIEARRLPEYNTAQAVDANPVAACYIPTIPGAQIWFEYSIDGPHPPNAMYLFKLFIDGRHVTTWDCTAKHTYHGKVAYSLHVVKSGHYGGRAVVQNSLMFSVPEGRQSPATRDDCIEIRVHRIQKRRRIRQLALDTPIPKHLQERSQRAVRLADVGLIEPGRPARRYQYLLLDPQDEPYATFRFYCRSPEYLAVHNLLGIDRSLSPTSLATSSNYVDADSSPWRQENGRRPLYSPERSPWSSPHFHGPEVSPQRSLRGASVEEDVFSICSPPSPKTKDSIEDLPSSVPRSPQAVEVPSRSSFQPNDNLAPHSPSQQSSPLLPELDGLSIGVADSPTVSRPANENVLSSTSINTRDLVALPRTDSPRPAYQRHKPSSLKLTLDGGALDVSNQPPRPLSPFTRAGFLRRLTSSEAASRPTPAPRAASAEPSVPTHEETERYSKTTSGSSKEEQEGKQSKAQRSGHPFLGFLGRRSDRRSAT